MWALARNRRRFLILFPLGVDLDRLGHQLVAYDFQTRPELAPPRANRKPLVGGFNKIFLGLRRDIP